MLYHMGLTGGCSRPMLPCGEASLDIVEGVSGPVYQAVAVRRPVTAKPEGRTRMNVPGFTAELSIETSQRDFVGAFGKAVGRCDIAACACTGRETAGLPLLSLHSLLAR